LTTHLPDAPIDIALALQFDTPGPHDEQGRAVGALFEHLKIFENDLSGKPGFELIQSPRAGKVRC